MAYSLPAYGLAGLTGILSLFRFRKTFAAPNAVCFLSSLIFFGYVIGRAFCSPVEYLARADLFTVLGALAVYCLTAFVLTESGPRRAIVAVLLLFGLAHLAVGAIQFTEGNNFHPLPFLQGNFSGVRATGFYLSPDRLAGFLEIVISMGLSLTCWGRGKLWVKMLVGYGTILSCTGMLITGSRGGYLSAVFGIAVFCAASLWLVGKRISNRFWWVLAGVVVALLAAGGGLHFLISRNEFILSRVTSIASKVDVRPLLWEMALKQFALNPAFGTGSGTFLYYARYFRHPTVTHQDVVYAHNDYLHLLAEYGTVGGVAFLFFLVSHLIAGWKSVRVRLAQSVSAGRNRSDVVALVLGSLGAVAAYMVHSVFDFNLHAPANAMTLAIAFGILANPGTATRSVENKLWRFSRWTLPVLGLAILCIALPKWPGEYFLERSLHATRGFDFPAAIAFATEGLRYERTNPYLYSSRANASWEIGVLKDDPSTSSETRNAALRSAVDDYGEAIKLFPQDGLLHLGMAQALDDLQRFDEAEICFQRAMSADPNSGYLRARYGHHFLARGDLDGAEREFKRAQEINPDIYGPQGLIEVQALRQKAGQYKPPNP